MTVQKNYEAIPAWQTVQDYVVKKLIMLSEMSAEVQRYIYMRKRDRQSVAIFKSEVMNFYQYLRPKIMNYTIKNSEYMQFVQTMDRYIYHPSRFNLLTAIIVLNNLNQFCEEYGLTRLTRWTGVATSDKKEGGDILKVKT